MNARLPGVILLAGLAAGCASAPVDRSSGSRPADAGEAGASELGAAGSSLLSRARSERASGNFAEASLTLERALRIEPQQPALWLELARVRLAEGNFAQAEQMARKACTLAPSRSSPAAGCGELIEEARRRAAGAGNPR